MTENNPTSRGFSFGKPAVIAGSVVGAVVLLLLVLTFTVFIPESVKSQGNKLQNSLMGSYQTGAAQLHTCKAKAKQAANVAGAQVEALDKVLNNVIGGKYGTEDPSKGTSIDRDSVFAILRTNVYPVSLYPDTAGVTQIFQEVMAKVVGCQDDFLAAQKNVQQAVLNFNNWREGSWTVRTFGGENYPTDSLKINIPNVPALNGQAALDKMAQPIVDTDTAGAYGTGLDDDSLKGPFATPAPTPSK